MDKKQIYEKLDKLFENKKSKNFINHLVRGYLPVDKVTKVMDKPENLNDFKCALTGIKLISVTEAIDGMTSEKYKEAFFQRLKDAFDEEKRSNSAMEEMLEGRVVGFTGEKTNTYMCLEAFQAFYDWVIKKMLSGDKHINWLLSTIQREQFLARAESVADTKETMEAVQKLKKNTNQGRKPSTTFGDLKVLQELKVKMDAAEKND